MKHKVESTETVQGIDPRKRGVFLGSSFMATMDGGKTRFPKHFTRLVLFENEKLFDQFVNEVKVGETVSTVTVADGLDDAYLIAYSRKKAIAK